MQLFIVPAPAVHNKMAHCYILLLQLMLISAAFDRVACITR